MNKFRVVTATLAMAAASTVHAQSAVQVYGLIDTAVEHLTNVNVAGDSLTRMPNLSGGMYPSRIGFRGAEELGNGMQAVYQLETGFSPDIGGLGQGNRLFGRQAWVGLSGSWGTVTVGRNYSMLFQSFADVDIIGPAQFSVSSLDSYIPNARSDNSIAYKGKFAGVTIGATYSFGRDASNAGGPAATNCGGESATDSAACRNWSALARYDGARWGLLAAFDKYNGGAGAAAPFGPTSSALSDTRLHVGGFAKFGGAKIGGGWMRRDNEGNARTPKSELMYLGAAYDVMPSLVLDGQVARLDVENSANDTNVYVLRAVYHLSKRTAVYALLGRGVNSGTAGISLSSGASVAPGGKQNGVLTGIKHSF